MVGATKRQLAIGEMYFCDIEMDYKIYQPRSLLCDRMEQMMEQTGENGFHYVMKQHLQH
jgi:hypothetical protein